MVDIVIPVHGNLELLGKTLDSIPGAFVNTPYRIYIYDNKSPIELDELREFYSRYDVKVSMSSSNVGFPTACNLGARKGHNKLIFLLNSDVILDPGSGDELVSTFEDSDVSVAGMKLLFADDRHSPKNSGNSMKGKIQHVGISFNIEARPYHIFLGWSADNPRPNNINEVPAVTGAALMTRRSVWKKVKGFDRSYGMGTFEDVDYCLKVIHAKLGRVVVNVNAVGHHYVGATSSKYDKYFNLAQNHNIFYNKWSDKLVWSDGYLL